MKTGKIQRGQAEGQKSNGQAEQIAEELRQKHNRQSGWYIYFKADGKSRNKCAGGWGRSGDGEWQEKRL